MESLFPPAADMTTLSGYVVTFVGYGIVLGLAAWLIGTAFWFVLDFIR